jgi:hypothetical protein
MARTAIYFFSFSPFLVFILQLQTEFQTSGRNIFRKKEHFFEDLTKDLRITKPKSKVLPLLEMDTSHGSGLGEYAR